ncbi:hypothetical protein BD311DRAFT_274879 [Dichomitus squalens]|uniref:Uncharacterized protein n=1 Tax=Dichomitus squalens TaxID=114155 RepID=A0A4V2K0K5_9APHY|nr:hypothetical protein BD311DRAFT_274879 [Dichomitus squalens]
MSSLKLVTFLTWLADHHVHIHEGISISENGDTGLSVISHQDRPILHPDRLSAIPKTSVLSVRTCTLAHQISWHPYGHGSVLALSFALYSEL